MHICYGLCKTLDIIIDLEQLPTLSIKLQYLSLYNRQTRATRLTDKELYSVYVKVKITQYKCRITSVRVSSRDNPS